MGKFVKVLLVNVGLLTLLVVSVFFVFHFFPQIYQVNPYYFPYLGTHYDYETDSKLVFRARPTKRVFESFGSYFKEEYRQFGSNPTAITFDITIGPSGFREDGGHQEGEILVLGDSFIQIAENDSDSFNRRLDKLTNRLSLNRGLAWYGPFQYLEVFRRQKSSKTRVALFCVFEGNDLGDIREYLKWKKGGDYYDKYRLHPDTTLLERFRFFLEDFVLFPSRLPVKRAPEFYQQQLVEVSLNRKPEKMRFGKLTETRSLKELLFSEEGKALGEVVKEFKKEADRQNIFPVLLFIPMSAHVYAPYATENSGSEWMKVRSQYLNRRSSVRDLVHKLSKENALDFIDLVPSFEAKAREGVLVYYPFDSHWNSTGRQVAAEKVTEFLKEKGRL